MTPNPADIATERSRNERYLALLRDETNVPQQTVAGPRNTIWTNTADRTRARGVQVLPLAGRVGLELEDELLGRSFYVGSEGGWYQEIDGHAVISWAAPMASLFYEGPAARNELGRHVVVLRTFDKAGLDIVGFDDDRYGSPARCTDPFDELATGLAVPAPTRSAPRPRAAPPPAPPPAATAKRPAAPARPTRAQSTSGAELRADSVVRAVIERPRTGRLGTVLGTLQEDQYRLVSWDPARPLIVQGAPGTGKTIIATHRAAFLTHPERGDAAVQRVVLVGPTPQYDDHVKDAVRALDVGRGVEIRNLAALLGDVAELKTQPMARSWGERVETDWVHARILQRAARQLAVRQRTKLESPQGPRFLVEHVLRQAGEGAVSGAPAEIVAWYRNIKTYERARNRHDCLPFLAATSVIARPQRRRQYDNVIVDEAQDVRPLEWFVLTQLAKTDTSLSLFGDMHQRRCDWSPGSWAQLAEMLEWTDEGGTPPVQNIATLYRSTRQILTFAGGLLPKSEQAADVLREGPPPRVVRARELAATIVSEAVALNDNHPEGMVAVIAPKAVDLLGIFRRSGWKRDADRPGRWTSGSAHVMLLDPDEARGLEFDGVLVVEPSAFPQNLGRVGSLYTSLTRATTSLTVVYSNPLPKGLKR